MCLYIRKVKFDYWWLDLKADQSDFVDYQNTIFVEENFINNDNLPYLIPIANKEDYTRKRETLAASKKEGMWTISGQEIVMNNQFDKSLDLFEIGILDANTYVTKLSFYTEMLSSIHL